VEIVKSLSQLEAACLAHHRALAHREKTIEHFQDSFRLMDEYLQSVDQEPTCEVFISQTFQGLAAHFRRIPTRGFRDSTERSVHGIVGVIKDWRAFCHWTHDEGHFDTLPEVPVPTLLQRLFPVLTEAELALIFNSRQLDLE